MLNLMQMCSFSFRLLFFLMLWNVNFELMRYLPPWLRVQIFVGFTLKAKQALDLSDLKCIWKKHVKNMASHLLTKYIPLSKSCQSLHSLESQRKFISERNKWFYA